MKKTVLITFLIIIFLTAELSYAQQKNQAVIECQPTYGHYWRSSKWGWYGARRVVRTPVEAKEILEQFFVHNRGISVIKISEIRDRPHFFVAEIINSKGVIVDLILIDKRTGRIRSMF